MRRGLIFFVWRLGVWGFGRDGYGLLVMNDVIILWYMQ